MTVQHLFQGFSKLDLQERLLRLQEMGALNATEAAYLQQHAGLDLHYAEHFIENVIGYYHLPLGVAANFCIDAQDYVIPMAVEETSIIAAASKTARFVRENGEIHTKTIGDAVIGQIQLAKLKTPEKFLQIIQHNTAYLMDKANQAVVSNMVKRGGGLKKMEVRFIAREDGLMMGVVHLHVNTCDAMGANIVNQLCEYLKPEIEALTDECVTMCILSNLADSKLTQVTVVLHQINPELAEKISEASLFATVDPYRAATHNKGVLNGMDPILIATGNDWRAVEAGVHAYAARSGQYRAITQWRRQNNQLIGELTAPIIVGTVGGVTTLHPTAKLALKMLKVENADHLARIIGAVGLVQNLGAMKALTTEGIISGHMKLHISNLSLSAGATEVELPLLQRQLEELLKIRMRISLGNAVEILRDIRAILRKKKESVSTEGVEVKA